MKTGLEEAAIESTDQQKLWTVRACLQMPRDRGDTQASIFPINPVFAAVSARKWLTHNIHGPLHSALLTLGLTHHTRS